MTVTRRAVLAGLAAGSLAPALAAGEPRVVAFDWALASTLVSLGLPPLGVGEPGLYRQWVGEPALPASVHDLGLRGQPNLEWTAALRPDLVLIGPLTEPARPALERIGPVASYTAFTEERRPLEAARAIAIDLGRRLDREAAGRAVVARAEAAFAAARRRIGAGRTRPLLLVGLLDDRHLNVYGAGSLFGDVLGRLGLENAWDRPTSVWGASRAGIEALAAYPDVDLAVIEPVPPSAAGALSRPGLWTTLAAARRGRTLTLPAAWAFGDLVAAARFAGLVTNALADAPAG